MHSSYLFSYIGFHFHTCGATAAVPAVAMALSLVGNQTLESREQALHSKRLVTEATTLPANTSQNVWGSERENTQHTIKLKIFLAYLSHLACYEPEKDVCRLANGTTLFTMKQLT